MNQRPRQSSGQRIEEKSLLNSQHEEANICTVGKQEHTTLGTLHFFFKTICTQKTGVIHTLF